MTDSAEARIARGASALALAQPVIWGAGLATAVILPHFLGDQVLGQVALATTVATLTSVVTSLGLTRSLTRRVATAPELAGIEVPAALALLTLTAALAAATLSVLLPAVGVLSSAGLLLPVALAGMALWQPRHLLSAVFAGGERFRDLAAVTALGSIVSSCAGLIVVATTRNAVAYLAVSGLISAAIGIAMWRMSRFRFSRSAFDPRLWKQLVRGGMPFLGWALVLRVYGQSDTVLLAFLSTEVAIGWYAAAYKIVSVPLFVCTLISAPLLPVLSRCASEPEVFQRTLRRSLLASLLIVTPTSLLIIALAPVIPDLLGWPKVFHNAVPLIMILALHEPFVAADVILGTALVALGRETPWMWVGVVAAFFNPAANFVLIPIFQQSMQNGAIAAAIVTVVTEALLFGGALVLLPRGSIGAFRWEDLFGLADLGRNVLKNRLNRLARLVPHFA